MVRVQPKDLSEDIRIAEMVNSTLYYYHEDILGSTRLLSTGSATTQFSSNYLPYGPNYGSSGAEVFQYTGKPQDSVTGYYNFGARYYDPSTGRFITQDSSSGIREDPQSLNRYAYARNNPEGITDPNGHGWNPFAAVASAVSNAATGVATVAASVASPITNWYSSQPPQTQVLILTTVVVAVAVATAGVGVVVVAPAVGAAIATSAGLGITGEAIATGAAAGVFIVPAVSTVITTVHDVRSKGKEATAETVTTAAEKGLATSGQIATGAVEMAKSVLEHSQALESPMVSLHSSIYRITSNAMVGVPSVPNSVVPSNEPVVAAAATSYSPFNISPHYNTYLMDRYMQ